MPEREERAPRPDAWVARFDRPEPLLRAARELRAAGVVRLDAHSPYPLHGADEALGIRPTRLPWLVLGAGLVGLLGAFALQWWTNAVDYPFRISGKPDFSLPASFPVAFEVAILLAAATAFFGMLALNRLPRFAHPVLRSRAFEGVTDDRFALYVEAGDPALDASEFERLTRSLGATRVESCALDGASEPVPRGLKLAGLGLLALACIPPAAIYARRSGTTTARPIHLIQDMDAQAKRKAQSASSLFADGRSARPRVPGTVGLGELEGERPESAPRNADGWVERIPIPVHASLLERGRERYAVHCAPCHGESGSGDGPIARRADALSAPAWVPPTNLHEEYVRDLPDGQLYDVVENGVRSMSGYGGQLVPRDRWAIVAYLRALQRSRNASLDDVPGWAREELR